MPERRHRFQERGRPKLVKLTFETPGLLGCALTSYDEKSVEKIYVDSF